MLEKKLIDYFKCNLCDNTIDSVVIVESHKMRNKCGIAELIPRFHPKYVGLTLENPLHLESLIQ